MDSRGRLSPHGLLRQDYGHVLVVRPDDYAHGFSLVKHVESHRESLMRKLGVYTVAGLTKIALEEGLIP